VVLEDGAAAGPSRAVAADGAAFVGREPALAALREAWAEARSRRGGIALVNGPPGVGKTRLGAVFAAEAERDGARVLAGAAREGEGVPAFWPWAQVLRRLLAAAPEAAAELEEAGTELAGLVPGLVGAAAPGDARHATPAETANAGPEQSRFLLFDAVARALCRASRERPLLILLDDLQWAGSPALRLLEHLGHELLDAAILVVAGVRSEPRPADHPLERALPALRRHARCTEIALRGFSRREVAHWLEQELGRPPPADLTSTLYARTEGVPLFVREAIRLLAERGELRHPERVRHWSVTLPGQAFDLIRRPLAALSPEATALVGAGAVIGREFALPFAAAVAGVRREAALDRLDEARRAGVLEPDGEAPGGWRFVHALFREAALAAVPAGARAQLHARAAAWLEQRHAAGLDAVIAEVAHHRHAALAAGDAERAWQAATRAAALATRQLAWEQAALHHEQAVAALETADAPDPERRLAALLALGEALRRAGDRERRLAACARALEDARSLGRPRDLARAAIGACDLSEWAPADDGARAALHEALAALGDEPSVESARARARLAYLAVRDPGDTAEASARRAVAEARAIGDAPALQEALYVLHFVIGGPERLEERAGFTDELVAAAERSSDRDTAVIALIDVASDRIALGDAAGAAHARARAAEIAGPRPHLAMAWHLHAYDAGLALLAGRAEEAEARMAEALAVGRRAGHPYAEGVYGVQGVELARLRDDPEGLLRIAEGDPWRDARPTWLDAMAARAHLALGREAEARARFEALAGRDFAALRRNVRWTRNVVELAGLCADLRDEARAAELAALLAPFEAHHAVLPVPICYGGPVGHALGRLHGVSGASDLADQAFARAALDARALGARPSEVWIAIDHALLRAWTGDRRGARESLAEADALASGLALPALDRALHRAQAAANAG
jgi:hypothetical protein